MKAPLILALPLLVVSAGLALAQDATPDPAKGAPPPAQGAAGEKDGLLDLARASKLPDVTRDPMVARELLLRRLRRRLHASDYAGLQTEVAKLMAEATPAGMPHSPPWRLLIQRLATSKPEQLDGWVKAVPTSLAARLVRAEATMSRSPLVHRKSGVEAYKAELEKAKRDTEKALTLDPKHEKAFAQRLRQARGLQEAPEQVKPVLAQALAAVPQSYMATRQAIEYWRARNAAAEVNAILKRLQTDLPGHPTHARISLDLLLARVQRIQVKDPRQRIQQVRAFIQQPQVRAAMGGHFKAWMAAAPQSPDPFVMRLTFGALIAAGQKDMWQAHVAAAQRKHLSSLGHVAGAYIADPRRKPEEVAAALRMATMGAVCGEPGAMAQIGSALLGGRGVERAPALAVRWLDMATRAQNPLALRIMADCLYSGVGVAKDAAKARKYYELAAKRGNMDALVRLGVLVYQGAEGKKEPMAAAKLWSQAAQRGHPLAMVYLGQLFQKGEGVPKDVRRAAGYYQGAARRGLPKAKELLEALIRDHPELTQRPPGQPGQPGTPPPGGN